MYVASTQYSVNYQVIEIYISGCEGFCPDCHNKELWNFKQGWYYRDTIASILRKIEWINRVSSEGIRVSGIWVLGGEPLSQNLDLLEDYLKELRAAEVPITLFTHFDLSEVPTRIIHLVDRLKTGRFLKEQKSDSYFSGGIRLASMNQKVVECRADPALTVKAECGA